MKKLKYFFTLVILVVVAFIHFYLPRIITEIKNPIVTLLKGNYYKQQKETYNIDSTIGKSIEFKTFDQVLLKGYHTYSKQEISKGVIILLHGIRSQKEHFILMSNRLSKRGYDVVAIDLRAHGESEGVHCTFGVKEKQDLKCLIDFLEANNDFKSIGIWGQSLGGAIGLQALMYDSRINFGIIESTFSDLSSITNDYLTNKIGFEWRFFSDYLLNRAGAIAGFKPKLASPIDACKVIKQPVLMVHGSADRRIKIEYSMMNFGYLLNKDAQYIQMDGANHLNVWEIGGDNYLKEVFNFLENNSGE